MNDDPSREGSRLTKVRLIFAAELTLALWLTLAGHALLDLDWTAPRPWAGFLVVASAVLGIAGCALALSSAGPATVRPARRPVDSPGRRRPVSG